MSLSIKMRNSLTDSGPVRQTNHIILIVQTAWYFSNGPQTAIIFYRLLTLHRPHQILRHPIYIQADSHREEPYSLLAETTPCIIYLQNNIQHSHYACHQR